jgi:hypothetical protein
LTNKVESKLVRKIVLNDLEEYIEVLRSTTYQTIDGNDAACTYIVYVLMSLIPALSITHSGPYN